MATSIFAVSPFILQRGILATRGPAKHFLSLASTIQFSGTRQLCTLGATDDYEKCIPRCKVELEDWRKRGEERRDKLAAILSSNMDSQLKMTRLDLQREDLGLAMVMERFLEIHMEIHRVRATHGGNASQQLLDLGLQTDAALKESLSRAIRLVSKTIFAPFGHPPHLSRILALPTVPLLFLFNVTIPLCLAEHIRELQRAVALDKQV
jgi:hypothetical protein